MASQIHGDLATIHDEDLLRRMWQQTEDFGLKKEIRTHMYKLREARLRNFYTTGEMDSPGFGPTKTPLTPSHGESLADQSFQSFKTKEIRDSESPTHELKFTRGGAIVPDTSGWNVLTSSEISPDGKAYKTESIATTEGVQNIPGGRSEFAGKNEHLTRGSHHGDDRNYVKTSGESSATHLQEQSITGDENSGRIETKSSSTTSSSKVTTSKFSSTGGDPIVTGHEDIANEFDQLLDSTRTSTVREQLQQKQEQQHRHHEQRQQQHQQIQNERYIIDDSTNQAHFQTNRTITNQNENENLTTKHDSRNIQKEVDLLAAQPGIVISRTVDYPDPNTKVITETKSLPDGTTVTTRKYETKSASSKTFRSSSNQQHSTTSRTVVEDRAQRNRVEHIKDDEIQQIRQQQVQQPITMRNDQTSEIVQRTNRSENVTNKQIINRKDSTQSIDTVDRSTIRRENLKDQVENVMLDSTNRTVKKDLSQKYRNQEFIDIERDYQSRPGNTPEYQQPIRPSQNTTQIRTEYIETTQETDTDRITRDMKQSQPPTNNYPRQPAAGKPSYNTQPSERPSLPKDQQRSPLYAPQQHPFSPAQHPQDQYPTQPGYERQIPLDTSEYPRGKSPGDQRPEYTTGQPSQQPSYPQRPDDRQLPVGKASPTYQEPAGKPSYNQPKSQQPGQIREIPINRSQQPDDREPVYITEKPIYYPSDGPQTPGQIRSIPIEQPTDREPDYPAGKPSYTTRPSAQQPTSQQPQHGSPSSKPQQPGYVHEIRVDRQPDHAAGKPSYSRQPEYPTNSNAPRRQTSSSEVYEENNEYTNIHTKDTTFDDYPSSRPRQPYDQTYPQKTSTKPEYESIRPTNDRPVPQYIRRPSEESRVSTESLRTQQNIYTNKKISVDVNPTHEAFARSLRCVSPSDRGSVKSLRTSTTSVRSSASPDKRAPYDKRGRRSPSHDSVTYSESSRISSSTVTKGRTNTTTKDTRRIHPKSPDKVSPKSPDKASPKSQPSKIRPNDRPEIHRSNETIDLTTTKKRGEHHITTITKEVDEYPGENDAHPKSSPVMIKTTRITSIQDNRRPTANTRPDTKSPIKEPGKIPKSRPEKIGKAHQSIAIEFVEEIEPKFKKPTPGFNTYSNVESDNRSAHTTTTTTIKKTAEPTKPSKLTPDINRTNPSAPKVSRSPYSSPERSTRSEQPNREPLYDTPKSPKRVDTSSPYASPRKPSDTPTSTTTKFTKTIQVNNALLREDKPTFRGPTKPKGRKPTSDDEGFEPESPRSSSPTSSVSDLVYHKNPEDCSSNVTTIKSTVTRRDNTNQEFIDCEQKNIEVNKTKKTTIVDDSTFERRKQRKDSPERAYRPVEDSPERFESPADYEKYPDDREYPKRHSPERSSPRREYVTDDRENSPEFSQPSRPRLDSPRKGSPERFSPHRESPVRNHSREISPELSEQSREPREPFYLIEPHQPGDIDEPKKPDDIKKPKSHPQLTRSETYEERCRNILGMNRTTTERTEETVRKGKSPQRENIDFITVERTTEERIRRSKPKEPTPLPRSTSPRKLIPSGDDDDVIQRPKAPSRETSPSKRNEGPTETTVCYIQKTISAEDSPKKRSPDTRPTKSTSVSRRRTSPETSPIRKPSTKDLPEKTTTTNITVKHESRTRSSKTSPNRKPYTNDEPRQRSPESSPIRKISTKEIPKTGSTKKPEPKYTPRSPSPKTSPVRKPYLTSRDTVPATSPTRQHSPRMLSPERSPARKQPSKDSPRRQSPSPSRKPSTRDTPRRPTPETSPARKPTARDAPRRQTPETSPSRKTSTRDEPRREISSPSRKPSTRDKPQRQTPETSPSRKPSTRDSPRRHTPETSPIRKPLQREISPVRKPSTERTPRQQSPEVIPSRKPLGTSPTSKVAPSDSKRVKPQQRSPESSPIRKRPVESPSTSPTRRSPGLSSSPNRKSIRPGSVSPVRYEPVKSTETITVTTHRTIKDITGPKSPRKLDHSPERPNHITTAKIHLSPTLDRKYSSPETKTSPKNSQIKPTTGVRTSSVVTTTHEDTTRTSKSVVSPTTLKQQPIEKIPTDKRKTTEIRRGEEKPTVNRKRPDEQTTDVDEEGDSDIVSDTEDITTVIEAATMRTSTRQKPPVIERKESAPVYRTTHVEKDKMTRSTSDNLIRTTISRSKPEIETPGGPKQSPRKKSIDKKRPVKCMATKTINLTTTNNIINSEDMENVIVDIQQAKSSREPSPNRMVPTPVHNDQDTGNPRYPDTVQEPEDETRRKPKVKEIPIFEEDTNDYVRCHISEVEDMDETIKRKSSTTRRENIEETTTSSITRKYSKESSPSKERPYYSPSPEPDDANDEYRLSVHDKVNKFITTAEEVQKPKPSAPFQRDTRPSDLTEPDDCLLSVNAKVNKFLTTAETVTKPMKPNDSLKSPKRINIDEIDEELRTDECILSVSEKVNKFISSADKLTPQKSPQLVAKIERQVSRKDESSDEIEQEPEVPKRPTKTSVTDRYNPERLNQREKPITSKPILLKSTEAVRKAKSVFENGATKPKQRDILSRPSVWEGKREPDVKLEDIGVYKPFDSETEEIICRERSRSRSPGEDEVMPKPTTTPKTHKISRVLTDSVTSKKNLFENRISTSTTTTTTKQKSQDSITRTPSKRPTTSITPTSRPVGPQDSSSKKPQEYVSRRQPQEESPTRRPESYSKTRQPEKPSPTRRPKDYGPDENYTEEYSSETTTTTRRSESRSPTRPFAYSPNRDHPRQTHENYSPGGRSPRRPDDSPTRVTPRSPTRPTDIPTGRTSRHPQDQYPSTTKTTSRVDRLQTTESTVTRSEHHSPGRTPISSRKPAQTTTSSPRRPVDGIDRPSSYPELQTSTDSRPSYMEPTVSSTEHYREATDLPRSQPRHPLSSDSHPSYMEPTVSSIEHRRESLELQSKTHSRQDLTTTYSTGARPSYMEPTVSSIEHRRDSLELPKTNSRQDLASPIQTGPRPSYMEHTVSSIEHRRDSLDITKTHSRRTSHDSLHSIELRDGRPRSGNKFGVELKRTDSRDNKIRRKSSSSDIPHVEEIFDLELLERMLETVVGYEHRRRIRSQIRIVKKMIEEQQVHQKTTTTRTTITKKVTDSPQVKPETYVSRRTEISPDRRPSTTTKKNIHLTNDARSSSNRLIETETRHITRHEEGKVVRDRSISPRRKVHTTTETTTEVRKITDKPSAKKPAPQQKEDKPIWTTKNILKKPSEIDRTVVKRTTTTKTQKQRMITNNDEDCITSSYGIGPTDDDGKPLFGIRALKKKPQQPGETTKVTGSVVTESYYSENGAPPVGERKVTVYSTNPEDVDDYETLIDQKQRSDIMTRDRSTKDGLTSVTRIQKIGNRKDADIRELPAITDNDKLITTKQSKVVRKGSVKEMSEQFTRKESSSSITEKTASSSYPKAGLILRTKNHTNTEYDDPTEECDIEIRTTRKQSRTQTMTESDSETESRRVSKSTRSFLNSNGAKVSGVDDVLDRMRNADNVVEDGDSAEDQEARSLLNKFLGASVLMSGMQSMMPKDEVTETIVETPSKHEIKTTRITKTIKSTDSSSPVARKTCDIEEIWDDEYLKQLLENSTNYEERRRIRARIRQVMAEKEETCTTEKTETKEEDGAVVTTTTKVTTRTVASAPKPISPFAKFRQLDKQNSHHSPNSPLTPSSPMTPGGTNRGAPLFQFTDPALCARAATVKEQLLQWCQSKTKEYENVQITNFSTSWSDGLAFCALIHHFLPDTFDYSKLTPQQRRHNFELAFRVADEEAGIAPLLDVEDMVVMRRPDWKCVFTYVQTIFRRFRNCN